MAKCPNDGAELIYEKPAPGDPPGIFQNYRCPVCHAHFDAGVDDGGDRRGVWPPPRILGQQDSDDS